MKYIIVIFNHLVCMAKQKQKSLVFPKHLLTKILMAQEKEEEEKIICFSSYAVCRCMP